MALSSNTMPTERRQWPKGKIVSGKGEGYWEWYRIDERSGYFDNGEPIGEWTTYDQKGAVYKVTQKSVK